MNKYVGRISKYSNQIISVIFSLLCFSVTANNSLSECYGSTKNGKLKNGVKLPSDGPNFESYSGVAEMLGRTYVHSEIKKITIAAYAMLEKSQPNKVYKFAETGKKSGGRFKPHKTHQNGLSVDFMTPVINRKGQSVHLPTNPLNRFGYDIEFDKNNRFEEYEIDFIALAAHLKALHLAATKHGYDLWRVIFDPNLQPALLDTPDGNYIKQHIQLSTKPSWVRHDEHYHVDFKIPCEPLN